MIVNKCNGLLIGVIEVYVGVKENTIPYPRMSKGAIVCQLMLLKVNTYSNFAIEG